MAKVILNLGAICSLSVLLSTACVMDNRTEGVRDDAEDASGGAETVRLQGSAQKGPFVVGSSVLVSVLNSALNPNGEIYTTQTTNDRGDFDVALSASLAASPLSIEAYGYYFNEVTGALSVSSLTLRALYRITRRASLLQTNVNMVTHLTAPRIRALIAARVSFATAVAQAESELVREIAITTPGFSTTMDGASMNILGGDNDNNAFLLAVSSVMIQTAIARGGSFDARLQELLNTFALDFADGTLSSPLKDEITSALEALKVKSIADNLTKRFTEIGSTAVVPDMNRVLDYDRDGLANVSDNCPLVANPGQENQDGDRYGDACDTCPNTSCDQQCLAAGSVSGVDADICYEACSADSPCDEGSCVDTSAVHGICSETCDPLNASSCAAGLGCFYANILEANATTTGWVCLPVGLHGSRSLGEQCASAIDCGPGLFCGQYPDSNRLLCRAVCDPSDPAACPNAQCVKVAGLNSAFGVCQCNSGFSGDGVNCIEESACEGQNNNCDPNAHCVDTSPGFYCICNPGFTGDGFTCADINECAAGTDTCNRATQDCVNTVGSFTCNCKSGYQKDQSGACVDIDECAAGMHNCDPNATCYDQTPGFQCVCKSGYSGSGTTCSDINECTAGAHNCRSGVSTCVNTSGSFHCTDVNECTTGTHDCSQYATCTNIDCVSADTCTISSNASGYQCACNAGFSGGGHGTSGCYCDLSGFWAMRQLGDSERQVNGALTMDAFTYYVWELYKIEYDGQKLTFYKKGCGQDKWPEIHVYASGIIDEIYSTVTPIDAYDNDPLLITSETNQPNIIPNIPSFNTATDVALTGLHLNDPMNDPWPTDHSTITWVDPDNDGEPGYTLSSAGTTQHTRTHPDRTFDYWPNAATANITRRIACWSGATRIKGHLTIDSVSSDCSVLTGSVVVESSEGHTNACTLVPKEEWDNTDIICDSDNWMNAERCNSDEVTSYDNEAHAPDTSGVTVTYKLVKAGKLSDSQPTCATVRGYNFDQ